MANQKNPTEPPLIQAQVAPEMVEDARLLYNKVGLVSIVMVQGDFNRTALMDQVPLPVLLVEGGVTVNVATSEDGHNATANITLTAKSRRAEGVPDGEFGFLIQAIYRLAYVAMDNDLESSTRSKALAAVVSMSAVSHTWSFWREFVMQACQRMGIPPFVVPLLFTMGTPPPKDDQTNQTKEKHLRKPGLKKRS